MAAMVAESALPSHCSRLLRITINCSAEQSGAFFFSQAIALVRRVFSSGLSIPIARNSATAHEGALNGPVFTGGGGGSSLPFLPGFGAGAGSACAVCVLAGSALVSALVGAGAGEGAAAFAGGVDGAVAPPLAGAVAAAFGVGRAAGIAV